MTPTQEEVFVSRLLMYQDDVYAYVSSMLPRRADAEEVAQQTALVLWRCRQQFDSRRDFLPWAFGIARNEVRRQLRQRESKQVCFSPEIIDELAAAPEHLAQGMAEQRAVLESCLGELDGTQREFIERCYRGDESIKSIATSMAASPTAIYLRLHRLRKSLVDCVGHKVAVGAA